VLRSGNSWIQVAEKDEVRDELMHNLGIAVMTPLILGALLLLLVANLLVMYGLAPLRELAAGIEGREPGSLGQLEMSHVPQEVVPVVQALNELLSRVSLAFEHERRFTDAAAHELRTPLAALKIHADNLARASSEAERIQSMTSLRRGLERALKLADQMLAYSRTQDTGDREQRVPIRLADAVAETISSLEPLRRQQAQTVRLIGGPEAGDAEISGEPMKIQRLIRNLLDNASRYAPTGSEITIGISKQGDRVELCVGNHGAVIAPELRERIFEPYYRIPGSRSEGSGLGLAIVKEIADQHAATITLSTLGAGDGTVITVSFPRRE
jgi:two-component system, OmpR family, sensor histidine kinase QseC